MATIHVMAGEPKAAMLALRVEKPPVEMVEKVMEPIALQDGLIQIAFIVITVIVNQRGLTDAAAVGIVEKVEGGVIYTIEGNSGDVCRQNHYSLGYYEILGFGVLQTGLH